MKKKAKWALLEHNYKWFIPKKAYFQESARIYIAYQIFRYVCKKRLIKKQKAEDREIDELRTKLKQGLIKKKDLT